MDKPLRCVSWVAVSSKAQAEKESPEEQRERNLEVVERLGGVLVAELNVPGQSRDIVEFSEAEQEIMAYAELRGILEKRAADLLIFRDMSRLGRTAALTLQVAEMCHRAGVALYDRSSPPSSTDALAQATDDSRLLVSAIQGSMAQLEVRNLVRRYRYGMTGRLKKGKMPSNVPYGYRKVYAPDGTEIIEINEEQAEVVRMIVAMFLEGMSYRAIADRLNELGISSVTSTWSNRLVWSFIKRIFVYAGFVEMKFKGQPMLREEGNHEGIIDLETAKQVDRERRDRAKGSARRYAKLLSRVLVCEECGGYLASNGVYRNGEHYYRCHRCARNIGAANASAVRESLVIKALGTLLEHYESPQLLRKLVEETQPESSALLQSKLDRLEVALLRIEQERKKLIFMARKDVITIEEAEDELKPLDERKRVLQSELNEIQANMPELESSDERFERIRWLVRNFMTLEDKHSVDEANRILRRNFRVHVGANQSIHVVWL